VGNGSLASQLVRLTQHTSHLSENPKKFSHRRLTNTNLKRYCSVQIYTYDQTLVGMWNSQRGAIMGEWFIEFLQTRIIPENLWKRPKRKTWQHPPPRIGPGFGERVWHKQQAGATASPSLQLSMFP